MMMLIHRICMALRGLGRLHMVDRAMRLKAEMLLQAQAADRGHGQQLLARHSAGRHWEMPASTYVLS